MRARTSANRGSHALGYALLAASLFWLCGVCVTEGEARVYPGLEPGMSPGEARGAGQLRAQG